jgi:hypothetical protein
MLGSAGSSLSSENKTETKQICFNDISNLFFASECHLSGENREKLLFVGTMPARLLYDTFLQKSPRMKTLN